MKWSNFIWVYHFKKFVIWANMKDSPEVNIPVHFTISYDRKLTNKFAKENILKYTWKKQPFHICFLASQQFYEKRKGVLIQIQASTYMLKSFDCQESKQVRHADGFQ